MIGLLGICLSSSTASDDFGNFLLWKLPANDFLLYQRKGRVLLLNGCDYYTICPVETQEETEMLDSFIRSGLSIVALLKRYITHHALATTASAILQKGLPKIPVLDPGKSTLVTISFHAKDLMQVTSP